MDKMDLTHPIPVLHGKVLLVEDVEDNQILISFYIRRTGANADIVYNGQQALELLKYQSFDLIFMDMQMPVMDGLTATREIRMLDKQVPIIALTANTHGSDRQACIQAGANHFLTKPVKGDKLHEVLARYLKPGKTPVAEEDICASIQAVDPDIRDIVERYIAKLPDKIKDVEARIANEEWDTLQVCLHELKGASGNAGLLPMAAQVLKMEFEIQNGKYKHLPGMYEELERMVEKIKTCG